ncbi:MAG: DUF192 domain-containing protein [Thermoanaerobaculia bacterium]
MFKNLILNLFIILTINCHKENPQNSYQWPEVVFPNGKSVKVEIAKTEEERALGLMFRHSLPEDRGMLFIFEKEDFQSFWMKNCFFPLDLIFIDKKGKIVDIKENFEPCKEDPCPTYKSKEKAIYVLEVEGGFVRKNNIKIGIEVKFQDVLN